MQGKVAAQQESADVREKEKELERVLMRPIPKSQRQRHGQVYGAKESKEEQVENRHAPGRVPGEKIVSMHANGLQQFWQLVWRDETTGWTDKIVTKEAWLLGGDGNNVPHARTEQQNIIPGMKHYCA